MCLTGFFDKDKNSPFERFCPFFGERGISLRYSKYSYEQAQRKKRRHKTVMDIFTFVTFVLGVHNLNIF